MTEVLTSYTARKNKLGSPMKTAFTYLNVLESRPKTFIYTKDVLNYASKFGFIKQGGAWFTAYDAKGEELYKCQGGAKMAKYIELNPEFYISLKLQVYSKIYEPFEFYYHFNTLKEILGKEFEAMKTRAEEKIQFSDLDDEELEIVNELKEMKYPLTDAKVNEYLSEKQILSALFELRRFYSPDVVEQIKLSNE